YLDGVRAAGIELPPGDEPVEALEEHPDESRAAALFTAALKSRRVGGWALEPAFIDWSFVLYAAHRGARTLFISLPHPILDNFAKGKVDEPIAHGLAALATMAPAAGDLILTRASAAQQPSFFAAVDAAALAASLERVPAGKKKTVAPSPTPPE